ncbi:MAG: nucleotide sugar dehydrogenase [Candidatus Hermodarchaeota archaeon]
MNISVVGGGGRVGLPLSIALADASEELNIIIVDINEELVKKINKGLMPFREDRAQEKLNRTIGKNLQATTDSSYISQSDIILVIIGTPVDEYLNPIFSIFHEFFTNFLHYFKDGQTVILRSTVYPGTSEKIQRLFKDHNLDVHVSFCPERIAEGKAMKELYSLPQIISGFDSKALSDARKVFSYLTKDLVELSPMEAELAKLFTNSWRYIQFATANQYFMLAESMELDFYKIYQAMTYKYPRAEGFPRAGLTAGPCLFKDTMQLSAFSGNKFFLGHSAMLINEGLPDFIVRQLKKKYDLSAKTVGILGMAFKGESDDKRASLSYKLKRILEFEAQKVLCTDEYISDELFMPLEEVLEKSDILIVSAPHNRYRTIKTSKILVDVWNWVVKEEKDL